MKLGADQGNWRSEMGAGVITLMGYTYETLESQKYVFKGKPSFSVLSNYRLQTFSIPGHACIHIHIQIKIFKEADEVQVF